MFSGAFKFRGAANAVLSLAEGDAQRGVVTHSSGNHAGALARAAQLRGVPAHIVVPSNTPRCKIDAVKAYGGEVYLCEPTMDAREARCAEIARQTGANFVHPYNDPRVMAGQVCIMCALTTRVCMDGLFTRAIVRKEADYNSPTKMRPKCMPDEACDSCLRRLPRDDPSPGGYTHTIHTGATRLRTPAAEPRAGEGPTHLQPCLPPPWPPLRNRQSSSRAR